MEGNAIIGLADYNKFTNLHTLILIHSFIDILNRLI